MLSEKIVKALKRQVCREFNNSRLYLLLAGRLQSLHWEGFARWTRVQGLEELVHGQWLADYLAGKGVELDYTEFFDETEREFQAAYSLAKNDVISVFKAGLDHERANTKLINEIVELARVEKDIETETFFQKLTDEQTEEEEVFLDAYDRLKEADQGAMLLIDDEFGDREDDLFEEEFETWEDDGEEKEASTDGELVFASADDGLQFFADKTKKKIRLVKKNETFDCDKCGTKVPERSGYCVKCRKKVKKVK